METLKLPLRTFTASEYHRMAEAGILHEDDRVELIDGVIVRMAAIGSRHADRVNSLAELFFGRFGARAKTSIQNPVALSDLFEPQPDLMLLEPRDYRDALPRPNDVFLLVEIADSSLEYDLETKLPRYASQSVREVWIVDLVHDRIGAHRDPGPDGYTTHLVIERGESVAPEAFPDTPLTADEILG